MSAGRWTLDIDAEAQYLVTWEDRESDATIRRLVRSYLASLLRDPYRPALEDPQVPGVYSIAAVPGTDVGLVWMLNTEERHVVLIWVG